ncbi:MAG: galactose-1-epimerase [Alphaproteobacteria bacterium]|nr:MAG: galactose-1-epimerase [Alphaproteobacteria bacterium]
MTIIDHTTFGPFAGDRMAQLYRIRNANGIELAVTNLGCIITELHTPDRHGQMGDIVLGYDTAQAYYQDTSHMGSIAGRYAGRIAYGRCTIDNKPVKISQNHGQHHLHGGHRGFNKKLWHSEIISGLGNSGISFHLISPDADEGYPGELDVKVQYILNDDDSLHVTYRATTSKTTVINLTQHSYFNLSANAVSSIDDHLLTIPATQVLDCDKDLIPTGKFNDVENTPLDFRKPRKLVGEYDPTYILADRRTEDSHFAACLSHPPSGRTINVFTDQPSVQLYTAYNLTNELMGKGSIPYGPHQSVCLETQNFPDAPNHSHFPSAILEAGETFFSRTIFRFGCSN